MKKSYLLGFGLVLALSFSAQAGPPKAGASNCASACASEQAKAASCQTACASSKSAKAAVCTKARAQATAQAIQKGAKGGQLLASR